MSGVVGGTIVGLVYTQLLPTQEPVMNVVGQCPVSE